MDSQPCFLTVHFSQRRQMSLGIPPPRVPARHNINDVKIQLDAADREQTAHIYSKPGVSSLFSPLKDNHAIGSIGPTKSNKAPISPGDLGTHVFRAPHQR
jgi:hypothetical protein